MLRRILVLLAVLAVPLSLIAVSALPASADETPPALSPAQGPPGTMVTASATDWTGCSSMSVSGWGKTLGTVSIDYSGAFSLTFTVPSDAALGATQLQFSPTCTHSTYIAFVTFTVTQGTAPPPPNCPSVLFFGLHGVNEGSSTTWGKNIGAVWQAFHAQVPAAVPERAIYPYVKLDWPVDIHTPLQAKALQSDAQSAAGSLETLMYDHRLTSCGTRTRFVLAGYSLGAWAVDLALRDLNSTAAGQAVLAQVAGAGLMGDPAFPKHLCTVVGIFQKCREGVASLLGHGYPKQSEYLDNGLSKGFLSLCLSYSDTYLDPVCGGYGLNSLRNGANIKLHETGYQKQSGAAAYLGEVLASYAK